nr:DMT family transporter [Crocosphaera sp.]
GNLCALCLLVLIYKNQLSWRIFKQLNIKDWFALITVSIFAGALAPALFFLALDLTSVNNVVLISRIEPPLTLLFSVWLFRERINNWVAVGSVISFAGVVVSILLQEPQESMVMMGQAISLGRGEILAIVGAISAVFANLLTKFSLTQISLGVFSIIRTILGTIIFFIIVIKLYGFFHFSDVFSPFLWKWMFIYAAIIVVAGQLFWFMGLKLTQAADVSLANSFTPIFGVFFAYILLQEVPTFPQYIGGIIVIAGILLNQIGINRLNRQKLASFDLKEEEIKIGFKGV